MPRRGRRKAAPGLRRGPKGRVLRPCAAAIAWHPARRFEVVHFSMFVAVVAFVIVAAREPVARLVQAAAKPPRQLMACHAACDRGTPRATPGTDEGSG